VDGRKQAEEQPPDSFGEYGHWFYNGGSTNIKSSSGWDKCKSVYD